MTVETFDLWPDVRDRFGAERVKIRSLSVSVYWSVWTDEPLSWLVTSFVFQPNEFRRIILKGTAPEVLRSREAAAWQIPPEPARLPVCREYVAFTLHRWNRWNTAQRGLTPARGASLKPHVHHLRFGDVQRAASQREAVHHRRGLGLLVPHSLGGRTEVFQ